MKKILLLIVLLAVVAMAGKPKSSAAKAASESGNLILHVTAQDFNNKIYKGETIQFVMRGSGQAFEGKTGSDGKFTIELPKGVTYDINFMSLSGPYNCGEIKVPNNADEGNWNVQFENSVYELKNVLFDTGKATLKAESSKELNKLVEGLQKQDTLKIEIAGHTDAQGTEEYNMKLSQGRAESVAAYLVSHGIKAERLTAKGYGYSQPVADNKSEAGRAKNRRTEVHILNLNRD